MATQTLYTTEEIKKVQEILDILKANVSDLSKREGYKLLRYASNVARRWDDSLAPAEATKSALLTYEGPKLAGDVFWRWARHGKKLDAGLYLGLCVILDNASKGEAPDYKLEGVIKKEARKKPTTSKKEEAQPPEAKKTLTAGELFASLSKAEVKK